MSITFTFFSILVGGIMWYTIKFLGSALLNAPPTFFEKVKHVFLFIVDLVILSFIFWLIGSVFVSNVWS